MTLPVPYSQSGGMGAGMLLPLVGIASAAVSALVYAYVNVYSPVAGYISVAFVGLLAAGAAFPVGYAAKLFKCRNPVMLRINGIGTGIIATYLAWAFFAHVLLSRDATTDFQPPTLFEAASNPEAVWAFAKMINEIGWYTLGSSFEPKGTLLWIMWLIEAAIVIGTSYYLSSHFVSGRGFCEDCNAWCEPENDVIVPVVSSKQVKGVESYGLAGLSEVPGPDTETQRWLQIHSQTCPACGEFGVFGVNQIHVRPGKKDEPETSVEPIVPLSYRAEEDAAHMERISEALQEAQEKQFESVKSRPEGEAGEGEAEVGAAYGVADGDFDDKPSR